MVNEQITFEAINKTRTVLRQISDGLSSVQRRADQMNRQLQTGAQRTQQAFQSIQRATAPAAQAVQRVTQGFGNLGSALSGLGGPLRLITGLFGGLFRVLGVIGGIASRVFGAITGLIGKVLGMVANLVKAVGGALFSVVQRVFGFIGTTAKVAVLGLAAAMGALAKKGVDVNISLKSMENAFKVMLKSASGAKDLMRTLREEAKSSAGSYLDLGKNAKTALGFGFKPSEIKGLLRTLGDASAGLATDEDPSVMRGRLVSIFGQIRSKGKLQGDEGLQLAEAGIGVRDMLGLPEGSDMGDFSIPASVAIPKLLAGLKDKFNNLQASALETIPGKMATIGDQVDEIAAKVTEGLHDRVNQALGNIISFLDRLQSSAEGQQILATLTQVMNNLGNAAVYLSNILPNAVMWLGEFVSSGKAADLLANVWGWTRAIIEEVGKFIAIFTGGKGPTQLWQDFRNSAVQAIDLALRTWNGFVSAVSYFQSQAPTIFFMVQQGIDGITASVDQLIGTFTALAAIPIVKGIWNLGAGVKAALGGGGGAAAGAGAAGAGAAAAGGKWAAVKAGAAQVGPKILGKAPNAGLIGTAMKMFLPNSDQWFGNWGVMGGVAAALEGAGMGATAGGIAGTVVPGLGNGIGAVAGGLIGGGIGVTRWMQGKNKFQAADPNDPNGAKQRLVHPTREILRDARIGIGKGVRQAGSTELHNAWLGIESNPFFAKAKNAWDSGFQNGGLTKTQADLQGWMQGSVLPNQKKYAGQARNFFGNFSDVPPPLALTPTVANGFSPPRNPATVTTLPAGFNTGMGIKRIVNQAPTTASAAAGVLPNMKDIDAKIEYLTARMENLTDPNAQTQFKNSTLIPALNEKLRGLMVAAPYETTEKRFKRAEEAERTKAQINELMKPATPNTSAVSPATSTGVAVSTLGGGSIYLGDGAAATNAKGANDPSAKLPEGVRQDANGNVQIVINLNASFADLPKTAGEAIKKELETVIRKTFPAGSGF